MNWTTIYELAKSIANNISTMLDRGTPTQYTTKINVNLAVGASKAYTITGPFNGITFSIYQGSGYIIYGDVANTNAPQSKADLNFGASANPFYVPLADTKVNRITIYNASATDALIGAVHLLRY